MLSRHTSSARCEERGQSLGSQRAVSPSVHSTDVFQPGPESVFGCHRKCNSVLRHDLRHRMSEGNSAVDEVLALKHEVPSSIPPEATGKEKDKFGRICWGGKYRWIPGTR